MSWSGPESLPGTASLGDELDSKVLDVPNMLMKTQVKMLCERLLVILRDGRKLIGILRSFDQFANVVIEGAIERIIVGKKYCDLPLGLYIIRGENVVLIGALDPEMRDMPAHMVLVTTSEIRQAQKEEKEEQDLKGSMRQRMGEFMDLE